MEGRTAKMTLLEDMPIPRHEIGVELIFNAREIRRGGVVWRWVRMACSMLKDGQFN